MASSGKRKTTMAKLTRESKLRERRLDKQARKNARKLASTQDPDGTSETLIDGDGDDGDAGPAGAEPALEATAPAPADG